MSIKKKITSLLFRQTAETANSPAPPAPEPVEEEIPEIPAGVPSQSVLELPAEHPLYRLYNQRRQEAGYLPASAWTRRALCRRRRRARSWPGCRGW